MLQPASLKFTDFDLHRLAEGEDAGKLCLSLKGLFTDKSCKLSLDNPVLRDEEGFHTAIENQGDAFTAINLFLGIKKHFPSGWAGTILRRPAPEKVLRKLRKKANGSFLQCADLADNGAFGTNYANSVIKDIAFRCGFDNPERCTAAGRRRAGITKLVSSGIVPVSQVQTSARHKSATTNAGYHCKNHKAQALRHRAQQYNPTEYGDEEMEVENQDTDGFLSPAGCTSTSSLEKPTSSAGSSALTKPIPRKGHRHSHPGVKKAARKKKKRHRHSYPRMTNPYYYAPPSMPTSMPPMQAFHAMHSMQAMHAMQPMQPMPGTMHMPHMPAQPYEYYPETTDSSESD